MKRKCIWEIYWNNIYPPSLHLKSYLGLTYVCTAVMFGYDRKYILCFTYKIFIKHKGRYLYYWGDMFLERIIASTIATLIGKTLDVSNWGLSTDSWTLCIDCIKIYNNPCSCYIILLSTDWIKYIELKQCS